MNHLVATSRNIRHVIIDGKVLPEIEGILTVAEKLMQLTSTGVNRSERIHMHRFAMTVESARQVAKDFNEWADQAEKEAESILVKEVDECN